MHEQVYVLQQTCEHLPEPGPFLPPCAPTPFAVCLPAQQPSTEHMTVACQSRPCDMLVVSKAYLLMHRKNPTNTFTLSVSHINAFMQ